MRAPVLHVAPFLWSGAGVVITRLCEAQRRLGPVTIVTTGRSQGLEDWRDYRRRLARAGVTHHAIDFFHRDAEGFWSSAAALADLVREVRPGVIHAHAGVPSCGAVVARAMSGSRARLVGQMYSWGLNRPEWMNWQDAWGFSQTDRVVCSARAYWDTLVRYGVPKARLAYVPLGLPVEDLDGLRHLTMRTREGDDSRTGVAEGPVLGFVGRIERRKGQLALVEAFARLRRTHPRARLELVGPVADEAYAAEIREAAAALGVADAVRLRGRVGDVARVVRSWDLFVSLSTDEGQGLAVLEAMAVGVPVAARRVAGIADYLEDGNTGIVISSDAPARIAATLAQAIRSDARLRRIATSARRLVERRYSWDLTLKAFDRLYWYPATRRPRV